MADVYEFHVAGLLGPVLRGALADLLVDAADRQSVLTGTARNADDITTLLRQLDGCGIVATQIRISRPCRWRDAADTAATA